MLHYIIFSTLMERASKALLIAVERNTPILAPILRERTGQQECLPLGTSNMSRNFDIQP
jgi:hypothetical protein